MSHYFKTALSALALLTFNPLFCLGDEVPTKHSAPLLIAGAEPERKTEISKVEAAADEADDAEEKAVRKAVHATDKATKAVDSATKAEDKADKAEEDASEAEEKATTAADESGKATAKAEDAAKKAEKAADKAEEAATKIGIAVEKADRAIATADEANHRSEGKFASNRISHPIGAYMSLWGDPYPTTLGINLAYNVYDFTRVNIGIGSDTTETFKTTTAGCGAKFLVPGWPLTPVGGINLSFTKSDEPSNRNIKGFDSRGGHLYANFGVDWETGIGLNFAAGYVIPFQSGVSGSYYLNTGIFL